MGSVHWIQHVGFLSILEDGHRVVGLFPERDVDCLFRQGTLMEPFTDKKGLNKSPVKTRKFAMKDVIAVLNFGLQHQHSATT